VTQIQFILLTILFSLIQSEEQVRLERLARVFPYPITAESRRRKLQRFLDLPQLTIALIWFPLITYWLRTYCPIGQRLSIAIDRSQWGCINLFTLALIWQKRAIPLYWCLLPKLGNSNLSEQTLALQQVLPLLKEYKIIVLGDREFCSVDLGKVEARGKKGNYPQNALNLAPSAPLNLLYHSYKLSHRLTYRN